MWADRRGKQLWVNNDIDNTSTVIHLNNLSVLATVPTPADLVALGGKPHDVIIDTNGKYAYVSVVGVPGDVDYVVKYSTTVGTDEANGHEIISKTFRDGYMLTAMLVLKSFIGAALSRKLPVSLISGASSLAAPLVNASTAALAAP